MRLDVVAYPLQPFRRKTPASRQREMPDETPSDADAQGSAQAFDQDLIHEAAFDLLGERHGYLAQEGIFKREQKSEPGCLRPPAPAARWNTNPDPRPH